MGRGTGALLLVAAAALVGSPWMAWFGGYADQGPVQIFGTIDGPGTFPSLDLWDHRRSAAILLVVAGGLALASALAPWLAARVGAATGAFALGLIGLLTGRHVDEPTTEATYVLRGYGATVYSGVFGRNHATWSTVLVLAALALILAASVGQLVAWRRGAAAGTGGQGAPPASSTST